VSDESEPAVSPSIDYRARKRRIILLLIAASAVLGAVTPLMSESAVGAYAPAIGLPFVALGIAWCIADAKERGRRIGRSVTLLLVLLFVVGFTIYLFQTRGLGAFRTLAMTLVLVIGMSLCWIATSILVLWVGELAGFWDMVL
jgi:peptidoglycan/LPS O-acetylase OafA/YrhL